MDEVLRAIGGLLVLGVLLDIFFTVLFPASGHGPIRTPLERCVWSGFRAAARMTRGSLRRSVLAYCGPTILTATFVVWVGLLTAGWAMVFKPSLGAGIESASGPTDTGWGTAFYYSGFNLTTLGLGDLVPQTAMLRMLTALEAACGFTCFSMAITYFLSVYPRLLQRNAFALSLHHLSGQSSDAARLLGRLADGEDLSEARQHMAATGDVLRQIYEAQLFYPVLRHFHARESRYGLPRTLRLVLDSTSLIRSALDPQRYGHLLRSPAVDGVHQAAMQLLDELAPDSSTHNGTALQEAYEEEFAKSVEVLASAGLTMRPDLAAGNRQYASWRLQWEPPLQRLARESLCQDV